jgi:hypothetical protein
VSKDFSRTILRQAETNGNFENYYDDEDYINRKMLWSQSNAVALTTYGKIPFHYENEQYMSLTSSQAEYDFAGGYSCVGFIKAVSNAGWTGVWSPGERITTTNFPVSGTIIATFTNQTYQNNDTSHVAIFVAGNSDRIYVIDQNAEGTAAAPEGIIRVRAITFNGRGTQNAGNYYVVTN